MKFLCKIGIHRPLIIEDSAFVDCISKKMVFHARCSCNKKWLTNNFNGWFGFRVQRGIFLKYMSKNIWNNKRKS